MLENSYRDITIQKNFNQKLEQIFFPKTFLEAKLQTENSCTNFKVNTRQKMSKQLKFITIFTENGWDTVANGIKNVYRSLKATQQHISNLEELLKT